MSEEKTRDQNKFVVRMPDGMRDRIADAAKRNGRSMNAEIVQLLEMYYPPAPAPDEMADLIAGVLRMSGGDPPKERWTDLYNALTEFHARLLRQAITDRQGNAAGAEFDALRHRDDANSTN